MVFGTENNLDVVPFQKSKIQIANLIPKYIRLSITHLTTNSQQIMLTYRIEHFFGAYVHFKFRFNSLRHQIKSKGKMANDNQIMNFLQTFGLLIWRF